MTALSAVALSTALGCNRSGEDAATTSNTIPMPATETTSTTTAAGTRTTNRRLLEVDQAWEITRGYTSEQQQIIEAYIGAEQASVIANLSPPDPEWPDLARTMTGRYLANVKKVLAEDRSAGHAVTDPATFFIRTGRVQVESPSKVLVQACYVSTSHPVEVASGRLLEENLPYAQYMGSEMVLEDGTWKLEHQGIVKSWPGIAQCADPLPE